MKPLTLEWIEKAEGDFASAQREIRARKSPNYDAACFHSQQCIEKYIKARLQEADVQFGKIHDLSALLDLVLTLEPFWEPLRPSMRELSVYAVEFCYPGQSADRETALEAVSLCKKIRNVIRKSMDLKP
jgi:HEPN domain-containing protein